MIVLGVFRSQRRGKSVWHQVVPLERSADVIPVPTAVARTLQDGDAVVVESSRHTRKLTFVKLGPLSDPRTLGQMALIENQIPEHFSAAALHEAENIPSLTLAGREDLRAIPLVTIDGEDAKDFDDAVWASPDGAGGWHLKVAIADVSFYVPQGCALDDDAYQRGNSVYLPGFVVPMLPESLSNGVCSLMPQVERACVCAHMQINAEGELDLQNLRFSRGLMISRARLTYQQVEAFAQNGTLGTSPGSTPASEGLDAQLEHLWGAFRSLLKARTARQTLDFEMQERQVKLDEAGQLVEFGFRDRLQSHRLIEEMMIAANVAAATVLERAGVPCLYRVHEPPSATKIESVKTVLQVLLPKIRFPETWTPEAFMKILKAAAGTPLASLVHAWVLRAQSQACYSPANKGHFGLNLERYAHFTSPIRRYADLTVHRALVEQVIAPSSTDAVPNLGIVARPALGTTAVGQASKELAAIGEHLSITERQAVTAERSTLDRIGALYLDRQASDMVFQAHVTGVHRAGVFVTLDGLGITGMIPLQHLSDDRMRLDEKRQRFSGRHGHIELGASFDVCTRRVNIAKGWIDFSPLQDPSRLPAHPSSDRSSTRRPSAGLASEGRTRPKKHPDQRSKKSKRPTSRSKQRSRKT